MPRGVPKQCQVEGPWRHRGTDPLVEGNTCFDFFGHGLMLATCLPVNETTASTRTNKSEGEILFKAEFTDLSGSGSVNLASTKDQTGIKISLDQLDLSR